MARHRANPLDYSRKTWMRLSMGFTFLFLYFPIVSLIAFSFNDSKRNIVWRGFTTRYYEKAWQNDSLIEAFTNSLTIAFMSTAASLVLGTLAALLLWRAILRLRVFRPSIVSQQSNGLGTAPTAF